MNKKVYICKKTKANEEVFIFDIGAECVGGNGLLSRYGKRGERKANIES